MLTIRQPSTGLTEAESAQVIHRCCNGPLLSVGSHLPVFSNNSVVVCVSCIPTALVWKNFFLSILCKRSIALYYIIYMYSLCTVPYSQQNYYFFGLQLFLGKIITSLVSSYSKLLLLWSLYSQAKLLLLWSLVILYLANSQAAKPAVPEPRQVEVSASADIQVCYFLIRFEVIYACNFPLFLQYIMYYVSC